MIKGLTYNQNKNIYSRSWDSNNNASSLYNEKSKSTLFRSSSYHSTIKNNIQETGCKKEKAHKNFKNMLKLNNTSSSLNEASFVPTTSAVNTSYKTKKCKNLKIKSLSNNISNNYKKKSHDKNISCSVDDIYNIKSKSEFKTKTYLLKSLIENIEDVTEDTYYENEYSEKSFSESLSVCKSTSNGIVTKPLNTPTISEIDVTPAVVSIVYTKNEMNDLKNDLIRYTSFPKNDPKKNKNKLSNIGKSNNKSKFFGKKFFNRFKVFNWFDSQKHNNKKSSSLIQSISIDYSVPQEESCSSSNNSIKNNIDNEKSEITLVSSKHLNFEFTSMNNDSSISKDSNASRTFINNSYEKLNEVSSSNNKKDDLILDENVLSENSNISLNEKANKNIENKEIKNIHSENKEVLFAQNNSDDSSLFSSNSLIDDNVVISNEPDIIETVPMDSKNDIENIYQTENFNETHILSTSSPKLENDYDKKDNLADEIDNKNQEINNIYMDKKRKSKDEDNNNEDIDNESSLSMTPSLVLFGYETESEVDLSNKIKFESEIEEEIIAISSPMSCSTNENSIGDDNNIYDSSSTTKNDESMNENEISNYGDLKEDLNMATMDKYQKQISAHMNDYHEDLNNIDSSIITQINEKENESESLSISQTYNLNDNLNQIEVSNNGNKTINTNDLNNHDIQDSSSHLLFLNNNDEDYSPIDDVDLNINNDDNNNNNNNNNKINNKIIISDTIPHSINSASLSEIDKNDASPTLNTTIDLPTSYTLSSKTYNITPNQIHKLSIDDDVTDLISEQSPNSLTNINNKANSNHELPNASTISITKDMNNLKSETNYSLNLNKNYSIPMDANLENTKNCDSNSLNTININENQCDDDFTNEPQCERIITENLDLNNSKSEVQESLAEYGGKDYKKDDKEIPSLMSLNDNLKPWCETYDICSNPEDEVKVEENEKDVSNTTNKENNYDDGEEIIKIQEVKLPEKSNRSGSDILEVMNEASSLKKNQLKSVLKRRNRHSFPCCTTTPFEMSLLTHIPLNQIGDNENKISIPGVETIVVRQRRKSVNFDRNAFEKVCYFTSTEKPQDIHTRDVQIKEDETSSNSIQTLLNTEVQKLLSDEVTGKGEYSKLGKLTDTVCNSPESSEISEVTSENPVVITSKITTEPDALANLDIPSECKDKISKASLTSLTSLTSISDSISISKDSDSSKSNTLSITIKAEIEQQIKNNCLLKDSSLKLNDPSSSWSPIPRNVIHLPKIKNKSKDWEPHIVIESFELAPRFEGQTQDMWDILQVKLKVQNLDYHKKVYIRYTTNDWKNYKEEEAKFSSCIREGVQNNNMSQSNNYEGQPKVGLDRFIARIDASNYFVLPDCGRHTCMQRPTKMLLVARYEVLGTTYWDNNHFTDYKLELVRIPAGYDVPRHHGHSKAGDASIIACAACAEEKREAELANAKKLLKEDEKEKKERTKVRHFGGGQALLSNNFSVMSSTVDKDFSMDPNNIYAQEVMKNNKMKKEDSSQPMNTKEKLDPSISPLSNEIKSNNNAKSNDLSTNANSLSIVNTEDNYENYQNKYLSSLYPYDPYSCNYNTNMAETSSLYSSTYSDVYTYGEGISAYDPSYYTNNYSYNSYSGITAHNNDMTTENGKNNNENLYGLGYGRSRSYSTGSIYSSDYYERKNYFNGSSSLNNSVKHSSEKTTVSPKSLTEQVYPSHITNSETLSFKRTMDIETKELTDSEYSSDKKKDNLNSTTTKNENNINKNSSVKKLINEQMNTESDNEKNNNKINQAYTSYSITDEYKPTYQYNYNYNINSNTNQNDISQPYNSKYNLYNYNSLYANTPMENMYEGYSDYGNLNSSMLNDTNAFY